MLDDIRVGVRSLVKNPGFTAAAVVMLALGIGINAAVFTVTNAVLFKGFQLIARNDRLIYISDGGCCVSYPDFEDYRAQSKSFESMAIVHGVGLILSDTSGYPENLDVTEISADTFKVVGTRPIMGRDFTTADEQDGATPVAILSYGFWERRYGKDPSIIGRTVRTNGALTTFVGVMPANFSFPQKIDIWVPLAKTASVMQRDHRDTWCVVARLKDGVTIETARAEILGIAKRLAVAYPKTNQDFHPVVDDFAGFFIGQNAKMIYGSMWGAVGFVLLIACANLANLLLARAIGRSREISVRIALGAGRWRIIRQLLVESVMLAGVGGVLGWWIAQWSVRAYAAAMAQKSSWLIIDYTMDNRVLWYLAAISILTGLLFGLAPALRLSKLDLNSALKDGARGATGSSGRHLSAILVTAELALAIVLLAGAGVLMRSFLKIHNADIGVNKDNIMIGSVSLPTAKYAPGDPQIAFFDRLTSRLQALPGVESVALGSTLPSWGTPRMPYELEGGSPADTRRLPRLAVMWISPNYFRTLRASVVMGREFTDRDVGAAMPVAIVNQSFASRLWPGKDPLGRRFRVFDHDTPGPWLTVVGVSSNIVQNDQTRQKFDPVAYVPFRQAPRSSSWVMVKTRVASAPLLNALRQGVRSEDPDLPVYGPFDLTRRLEIFWDSRFYGGLFLIFAAIALLLASIGLYTVIAHSVAQRTQEIGVRMAIGASGRDILRLVFRQGMLPLAIGLVIGLAGSFAVNRLLESVLVAVSPADPLALAVASATLIVAAGLGCLIPAWRAMRVDPVVALRHD